jgi:hypothetical protein
VTPGREARRERKGGDQGAVAEQGKGGFPPGGGGFSWEGGER